MTLPSTLKFLKKFTWRRSRLFTSIAYIAILSLCKLTKMPHFLIQTFMSYHFISLKFRWLLRLLHNNTFAQSTSFSCKRALIKLAHLYRNFWPRALLKGPKRSFVVVVVLLIIIVVVGVETWVRNSTNGSKNVREQNLFQIEQKIFANKICS